MKSIRMIPAHPAFLEEQNPPMPVFGLDDYQERLSLLVDRMERDGLSHVLVHADREHFANMAYLIGFEPRFEESLLIVDARGACSLLLGNECMSYSFISPVPMTRILYQNFSLQGQPRGSLRRLREILRDVGVSAGAQVGIVGYKYFEPSHLLGATEEVFDVPAYLLHEVREAGPARVISYTQVMTGLPDGIRMTIRTPREIAFAEYAACRTTSVVQRMLKNLAPGIGELALSGTGGLDFSPSSVFPMCNFGPEHISTGLRSPSDTTLEVGDPCGMCYAMRHSLIARVGLAAYGEDSVKPGYEGVVGNFLQPFWGAVAAWYESLSIGVPASQVYDSVMSRIGAPEFGVVLNPGHYIGGDEWVNSPFYPGTTLRMDHAAHLQCDIIASSSTPVVTGICEDGIALADASLRSALAREFPEVAERIAARQRRMRDVLGIDLSDDVLPLGNLNGVYHPYMLDRDTVFALR